MGGLIQVPKPLFRTLPADPPNLGLDPYPRAAQTEVRGVDVFDTTLPYRYCVVPLPACASIPSTRVPDPRQTPSGPLREDPPRFDPKSCPPNLPSGPRSGRAFGRQTPPKSEDDLIRIPGLGSSQSHPPNPSGGLARVGWVRSADASDCEESRHLLSISIWIAKTVVTD